VFDVDETVLDNSPYQAWLVTTHSTFSQDTWGAWVSDAKAKAIPGALEFVLAAKTLGITPYYVTNRDVSQDAATVRNLLQAGFPATPETVLTRDEYPGGGEKGVRRGEVAKTHRILMLVGDNLGDFMDAVDVTPEQRQAMWDGHADFWGTRWIVLPNPQYGSWVKALLPSTTDSNAALREALQPWTGPTAE
jgi:acid phosphatase